MRLNNTPETYGLVSVLLHWLVAATIVGLFFLGWWMVDLTYYDSWYKRGPELHKSIGTLLFLAMLLRLLWRICNRPPGPEPGTSARMRRLARGMHSLLYLLVTAVILSGYLIATADGRPIPVFGLFEVPASLSGLPGQADFAGRVHWYLALCLLGLAAVHALAALKHHFIDRDRTLKKMFGLSH
jgi:cytochrome b561